VDVLDPHGRAVYLRSEAAQGEIKRIARQLPGAAPRDPLAAALTQAVEASETYSGLLVVDSRGQLVSAVGAGPAVESLVATLQSTAARESQLVDVMRSAQLRKALVAVDAASVQVLEVPDLPPLLLAGVPLPRASCTA
jgi:hypothetical protein